MYKFSVEVQDAALPGDENHYLQWSLVTEPSPPDKKYEGIFVKKQKSSNSLSSDEVEENIIRTPCRPTQEGNLGKDVKEAVTFTENIVFSFRSGYVKQEDGYHISLLIEAIKGTLPSIHSPGYSDDSAKGQDVLGKGMFLVYPRPVAVPHERDEQVLYSAKQVIVLARLLTEEKIPMVYGRLRLVATLVLLQLEREKESPVTKVPKVVSVQENPKADGELPIHQSKQVNYGGSKSADTVPFQNVPLSWDYQGVVTQEDIPEDGIEALQSLSVDADLPSVFKADSVMQREKSPKAKVKAHPLADRCETFWFSRNNYTSTEGTEDVTVIIYGAFNLPLLEDGSAPTAFACLGISGQQIASATTHVTERPTRNPSWHEALSVVIPANQVDNYVLELSVSDVSRSLLVNYHMPIFYLQPFYHHHLNLATSVTGCVGTVNVFATFIRRKPVLPVNSNFPPSGGLEVFVHGIEDALKPPNFPMFIVARIVTSISEYRSVAFGRRNSTGVSMEMVTFPSPHLSWFKPIPSLHFGHPQVCFVGVPNDRPQWNHPFTFVHPYDVAAYGNADATLVLELHVKTGPNSADWRIGNMSGFASLYLSVNVRDRLAKDKGGFGVYFPGILIDANVLKTVHNPEPAVDFSLTEIHKSRTVGGTYVNPRQPVLPSSPYVPYHRNSQELCFSEIQLDFAGRAQNSDSTTTVDRWVADYSKGKWNPLEELKNAKKLFEKPSKDELPSHDAIETLLPDYQYILPSTESPSKRLDSKDPGAENGAPARPEDVERVSMSLLDYQQQELEKYRHAVHNMGKDIVTLRQRVTDLEATNSQLRRDLAHYNDSTRLLLDAQEIDGLSRADIAERYVAIKHNLTRTSAELRNYKDKVLDLQNEIIKKNDKVKAYSKLSDAHEGQQDIVRRLQERATKVRRLEDVIRKQEKVIEKMEKMLSSRPKGLNKGNAGADSALNEALLEENKRLRLELEEYTAHRPEEDEMDKERLQLYSKLERAESRISSLEKQLEENARQWAREKSDLTFQIQEAESARARNSPNFDSIPKPRLRDQDPARDDPRRYSRYSRNPSPGRRNKPHIGYNTPHYDPIQHS